jgi:hypothetical protein
MSGHTKGPWTYAGEIRNLSGDRWEAREHIAIGTADRIIADMRPGSLHLHADARLIAAAPELVEALQAIVDRFERQVGGSALWQQAHAALAKATGEQL